MYDLALRSGEVCRVRRSDVDPHAGTASVRRVKGGTWQPVGLSPSTLEALRPFLRGADGPIFRDWTPRRVQRWFRGLAGRAGLFVRPGDPRNKSYSHSLRRGRATHMAEAGIELREIQRRLGHRSIATTLTYPGITKARSRETDAIVARQLDAIVGRR